VQERLRRHLAQCPACRGEAERLRDELVELRDLPRPDVPPFVITRVMAEVRAHRPTGKFALEVGHVLAATLAGLIVLAGLGIGTMLGAGLANRTESQASPLVVFEASDTAAPDVFGVLLGGE
jgi:predicted anti-sigma-YlaC factor YlaD